MRVDVRFDPTDDAEVPGRLIMQALHHPGVFSRDTRQGDEEFTGVTIRDMRRAVDERWEITLQVEIEDLLGFFYRCKEIGAGRVRLVGARWERPLKIVDRRIGRRVRCQVQRELVRG